MAMRLRKECSVILMRMRPAVLAAAIGMVTLAGSALSPLAAQSQDLNLEQLVDQQRLPAPPGDPRWRNPPTESYRELRRPDWLARATAA